MGILRCMEILRRPSKINSGENYWANRLLVTLHMLVRTIALRGNYWANRLLVMLHMLVRTIAFRGELLGKSFNGDVTHVG